jgi:ADP-dependent NAD(P)H-hydrate dehydratase / NAD(P)H-hydrate epimerase
MRLASVEQSRRIDELTQSDHGLSGEILMEAAGALSAEDIANSFADQIQGSRVAVVCGPGNNGGDGLVVARHLHSMRLSFGIKEIIVFLAAPQEKWGGLFKTQLDRCRRVEGEGLKIEPVSQNFERALGGSFGILVDAIFGIGLRSRVEAPYTHLIESMNRSKIPIVSLDTPSGLDADRGVAQGIAVRADRTLTYGLAKPGFFVSDGPRHVGRLKTLSIGFPEEVVRRIAVDRFAFTSSSLLRLLPKRRASSNKTHHGHALMLAGSPGMWGAGLLSASSASRVGAGYVTLASHEEPLEVLRDSPEILTAYANDEALWKRKKWTAVGIGPGLGTDDRTHRLLCRLIQENDAPVVADADAITVIAEGRLWPLPPNWVITPHAGELARILKDTGVSARDIEGDRFRFATEAAERLGCHVLLKGFRTVVASGGKAAVILSGNAALAKAGTGDVLTGMIVGLMAQGLRPSAAAMCGAYIHGKMADEWVRSGRFAGSLQASDLREILPGLMAKLARAPGL